MPTDPYLQFVLAAFFGFGLVMAAVANLAFRQIRPSSRVVVTLLAGSAAVFSCWLYEKNADLLLPLTGFLGATLVLAALFASPLPSRIAEQLRRPRAVWQVCCVLGASVVALSAATYEERDQVVVSRELAELESLEDLDRLLSPTQYRDVQYGLRTDAGEPVETWTAVNPRGAVEQGRIEDAYFRQRWNRESVLRTGAADDVSNCYGWVFTGGRLWIPATSAERILGQNGYHEVRTPVPGDLTAYRRNGTLIHLAVVRYTAENRSAMVEGKWGFNGVFLHAVDHSPFGREFTFLRSTRVGHLLNGLRDEEPPDERTE